MDRFHHLFYTMEMEISEANWHQLLRQNRGTHFTFDRPTGDRGYTIPPRSVPFSLLMEEGEPIYHL